MRKILIALFLSSIFSWNYCSAQAGSDVIICLDNSSSISSQEFSDMTTSTKALIAAILNCNPNNKVAVVHYGTNFNPDYNATPLPTSQPRIFIESDFTNNNTLAQSFSRKLQKGDHFHEAVGMMGNALDNISNVDIVSFQKTLNKNPANSLVVFLFTDADRSGGNLADGSYLVNYNSPALNSNGAFQNFTNFKNNRGAKFVVVHVMNIAASIRAAASIANKGGSYNGSFYTIGTNHIETYPADPDNNQLPRLYLNKTNFALTTAELNSMSGNICDIAHQATINFRTGKIDCAPNTLPTGMGGSFSIPSGASIVSLQLSLINVVTNLSYSVSSTPTITGNSFSFWFGLSDINIPPPITGKYKLAATLQYSLGSTTYTITGYNASFNGYDLNFDCCPDSLNITATVLAPNTDVQAANYNITASNIIEAGAKAVYHAGNTAVLKPGFHAKNQSDFRAYIGACMQVANKEEQIQESYYYVDLNANPNNITEDQLVNDDLSIIQIAPNPSDGIFKVILNRNSSARIQITDLSGRVMYEGSIKGEKETSVNVQHLASGSYILIVTFENHQTISKKIILK